MQTTLILVFKVLRKTALHRTIEFGVNKWWSFVGVTYVTFVTWNLFMFTRWWTVILWTGGYGNMPSGWSKQEFRSNTQLPSADIPKSLSLQTLLRWSKQTQIAIRKNRDDWGLAARNSQQKCCSSYREGLWRSITLCEGKTRKKQRAVRHKTKPTVSAYTAGYIPPIHHPHSSPNT